MNNKLPWYEASQQEAAAAPLTHVDVYLASEPPPLKIAVRGLKPNERQLLEGLVRVSQRRRPRLEIVEDKRVVDADLVLVDTHDAAAMSWARRHPWLKERVVIWIDGADPQPGHTVVRRPVQWPVLPMLLARALESKAAGQAAPPAAPARIEPAPAAHPELAPRVLVVDDSLAVRAHLRSLLERRSYVVTDADCVETAMDVLRQRDFDVVLMDVLMPGIDGYDGCHMIKERWRGARALPVVMLTSKSSPFDRIRGKMAGCDAYLTKPVDPQQLAEALSRYVRAAPAAPSVPAMEPMPAIRPAPRFAATRPS